MVLAVAVAAVATADTTAQSAPESVCRIQTAERIVAVGDVHGAYDRFVAILRAAALVDGRARWVGGRSILVQTGDVLDRGPQSRRVLDLLRQLERDAARAGGQVHALIGNHEVMRLVGHWTDVSAAEYAAFRRHDSDDVRERLYAILSADAAKRARAAQQPFDADAFRRQFQKEIPLGYVEMRQAFGPDRRVRGLAASALGDGHDQRCCVRPRRRRSGDRRAWLRRRQCRRAAGRHDRGPHARADPGDALREGDGAALVSRARAGAGAARRRRDSENARRACDSWSVTRL